jgi:hypothetical protein
MLQHLVSIYDIKAGIRKVPQIENIGQSKSDVFDALLSGKGASRLEWFFFVVNAGDMPVWEHTLGDIDGDGPWSTADI